MLVTDTFFREWEGAGGAVLVNRPKEENRAARKKKTKNKKEDKCGY